MLGGGDAGFRVDDRIVPLAPVWEAATLNEAKALSDGHIRVAKGRTIVETRISQNRYLEIPLSAALAALVLMLFRSLLDSEIRTRQSWDP